MKFVLRVFFPFFRSVDISNLSRNKKPSKNQLNLMLSSFDQLRQLQFSIQLFNQMNASTIWLLKHACIFASILCAFSFIRYNDGIVLRGFCLTTALDAVFIYIFIYDRAFSIQSRLAKTKMEMIRVCSQNIKTQVEGMELKKRIISIPNCGIRVGSFHYFERMSSPNFVLFVIFNLGRMLITFR